MVESVVPKTNEGTIIEKGMVLKRNTALLMVLDVLHGDNRPAWKYCYRETENSTPQFSIYTGDVPRGWDIFRMPDEETLGWVEELNRLNDV